MNIRRKKTTVIADRFIQTVFAIGILIPIVYAIVGSIKCPSDFEDASFGEIEEFKSEWTLTEDNGNAVNANLPGSLSAQGGETLILTSQMPETVRDNLYLCMGVDKQDVDIYIDDELRMSYSTDATRFWGDYSGFRLLFIKLKDSDAGAPIRIVSYSDAGDDRIINFIYIGERTAIWMTELFDSGLEVLVGIVMLTVFTLMAVMCIFLSVHYKKIIDLFYLGLFGMIAMIWVLCNSRIKQLYFSNATMGDDLSYMMLMLLPVTLVLYMDALQEYRYRRLYRIMGIVMACNIFISPTLQALKIMNLSETYPVSALIFGSSFLISYVTIGIDIFKGKAREYMVAAVGMLLCGTLTILQFVMFAFNLIDFSGINVAVGMIFVGVAGTYNTVKSLRREEEKRSEIIAQSKAEAAFLANMSHEIRTPINAILGMDELILRGNIDDETKEYAQDIQAAGQTLLVIVNDVLDESRIRSGRMEIVPVNYSLSQMVRELMSMFTVKAEDKGLKLELEIDDNLPDGYYGDDVRIRQILNNLISNAIKYTDAGKVKLTVSGTSDKDGEKLHFMVSDTGIGIREEDQDKLFSAFDRVDLEHNRNIEGTGLGLAISASLLSLMGSEMQVNSEYGSGSQFSFDLVQPVTGTMTVADAIEKGIMNATRRESRTFEYTAPEAHILVADDNDLNLKVFCKLLAPMQMRIDTAVNGMETLGKSRTEKYDLMFIDHMMPIMDGVETVKLIMQDSENPNASTPSIALTANAIGDARERYLSAGFSGFLAKPFVPGDLEAMLIEFLPQDKLIKAEKKTAPGSDYECSAVEMGELPEINGIDWNIAARNLSSRDILDSIITDFYKEAAGNIDRVRRVYSAYKGSRTAEALNEYRIIVHGLKNNAALIGAASLSDEARTLELAARDNNAFLVDSRNEIFCKDYMSMAVELAKAWGGGIDKIKREAADDDMIRGNLSKLDEAFEKDDILTMNDIMDDFEKYEYSEQMRSLIDELGESILELSRDRFDAVSQRIKETLK